MNQTTQTTEKRVITAADIPLSLKARYVGTGFVMGVFASPMVRGAVSRLTPRVSEILDKLTGQAESLAEGGSDFLAQARELLRRDNGDKVKAEAAPKKRKVKVPTAHGHGPGCDHDHDHDHAPAKVEVAKVVDKSLN